MSRSGDEWAKMTPRAFSFCIQFLTNLDHFVHAGVCVHVDVADSFAVAQHRDALGSPLDVPHQLGRTSGDDQVNELVQSAQVLHLLAAAHLCGGQRHNVMQSFTKCACCFASLCLIFYQLYCLFDPVY